MQIDTILESTTQGHTVLRFTPEPSSSATIDTPELLARLAHARARGPALLAIDGDGTLWEPDVGHRLVEQLLAARALRPAALAPLRELARAHRLPLADDPHDQLTHLVAAYHAGILPPADAFRIGALMFAGQREREALAWGERVVAGLGDRFRVRPGFLPVLTWARSAGVDVWVVSAGGWPGARAAALRAGVDPSRVIACATVLRRGHVTAELRAPIPHGPGKPLLLRARAGASVRLLAAFGDDLADLPLLAAAALPVALANSHAHRLHLQGLVHWDPSSGDRA